MGNQPRDERHRISLGDLYRRIGAEARLGIPSRWIVDRDHQLALVIEAKGDRIAVRQLEMNAVVFDQELARVVSVLAISESPAALISGQASSGFALDGIVVSSLCNRS